MDDWMLKHGWGQSSISFVIQTMCCAIDWVNLMNDFTVARPDLQPILSMLFKGKDAILQSWQQDVVEGGFGHSYGIYRVHGEALGDEAIALSEELF